MQNIEEFKDLLTNPEYEYYMHGTGRKGNDEQAAVISSIFENGLRTYKGRMFLTTEFFGDGNYMKQQWDAVKNAMDNWPHMGSKNIIIIRLPKKYLLLNAPEELGIRDAAFYVDVDEGNTEPTKYVNPKFIVGCYLSKTGNLTLNPKFEKELLPETIKELDEKYQQCLEEFEKSRNLLDNDKKKSSSQQERDTQEPSEEFQGKLTMDDTERLFE